MFKIRESEDVDYPFTLKSLGESYYHESRETQGVKATHYKRFYYPFWRRLIANNKVIVACSEESPWQIYGVLLHNVTNTGDTVVHYAYVKEVYREYGIAKALFEHVRAEDKPVFYTHRTHKMDIKRLSRAGLTYTPYLLMKELDYEGYRDVETM